MTGGADVLTSCHAIRDPATPPYANARVLAGGIPGAVSPLSRSDAQAPPGPFPLVPVASQRVP
jgi:hypothetical protein